MSGLKTLIVEDDYIIAKYIEKYITNLGCRIIAITDSGNDAVNKALNLNPDLILMDINLIDDIDGITAAKKIQKVKNIPVIYLTASTDMETQILARETNMLGFIGKPIDEKLLSDCILKFSQQTQN